MLRNRTCVTEAVVSFRSLGLGADVRKFGETDLQHRTTTSLLFCLWYFTCCMWESYWPVVPNWKDKGVPTLLFPTLQLHQCDSSALLSASPKQNPNHSNMQETQLPMSRKYRGVPLNVQGSYQYSTNLQISHPIDFIPPQSHNHDQYPFDRQLSISRSLLSFLAISLAI